METTAIVLTIPEPLYSELNSEIKELHKKYSKKCQNKHPNDGIYYDVPHITLLSMGNCFEHKDEIEAMLRKIAKKYKPIKIKSKELTLFSAGDLSHLVIRIEKNEELQKLHNEIVKEIGKYSEKQGKFILDLYNPHSSKILYLPKDIEQKVKKDAKIREFEFFSKEIGIKIRAENHYCKIRKAIPLGEK